MLVFNTRAMVQAVVGLLSQRHGFDPRLVHVRCVVGKVAPGQVFLTVDLLQFYQSVSTPDQLEKSGNLPIKNALS
jgi:hypothetical protein